MFHVGQHVVCVEGKWHTGVSPLIRGRVYTVSRITMGSGFGPNGEWLCGQGLVLCEVHNPTNEPDYTNGFWAGRFRPLSSTRLDVFRALLTKTPAPVPALIHEAQ